MENPKLPTIDELLAGTAQFDEKFYVSNKNGGYTLRDDILKKVLAEAEFRWNNGGKEIYEKLHSIEIEKFIKEQNNKTNPIEKFCNRLKTHSVTDWEKLFALIPEMEKYNELLD